MEENNEPSQGSAASNAGSSVHGEEGVLPSPLQETISLKWTDEEDAILKEGLEKYASESIVMRYAKIAKLLPEKSVRDVAFRRMWMAKKEIGKRRKEDLDAIARKSNDRKEEVIDAATQY